MTLKRIALALLLTLVAAPAGFAQTYTLGETPQPNSYFLLNLKFALTGEMKVHQEDKLVALKEEVTATHVAVQRILEAGPCNMAQKAALAYREAHVAIRVGEQKSQRALPLARNFVVSQRVGDSLLTYCPQGPMTREELEVTEHLDMLALTGLLPTKEVAVGESWKVANAVAQALCHFDGLTGHDLTCKLESVKDNLASVTIGGEANGIELGAVVKLKVQATYRFDLKQKTLVGLEWKQTDTREQGPISPASVVEATTTLERKIIENPEADAKEVGDFALVPVEKTPLPPESMTLLHFADPKGNYEFNHGREWHFVGRTEDHVVFRLIDKGEFIAQVSIAPWKKTPTDKKLSVEEFQTVISGTPGWMQDDVLEAKDVSEKDGPQVLHVAAQGELDDVSAIQHFYLVASPQGDRLLLAFTMTPKMAQRLNTRDLALVRGIVLTGPRLEEGKKE